MKKAHVTFAKLLLAIAFILQATHSFGQTTGEEIVGTWLNQEKAARIEIYKKGDTYSGKIVWLKEPNDPSTGKPKLDAKNPDSKLRSRPVIGSDILYAFTFDKEDKEWTGGTIYDARDGKTYKCYLKLNEDKSLKVRGYMAASWMGLGKTNVWTKAN